MHDASYRGGDGGAALHGLAAYNDARRKRLAA